MEVPNSLKRLVRTVMRGFYSVEHVLLMDMLIRKPCMREEELETLLRFERKHLRVIITQLKNDKMLKARLRMETGPDGKATRQNYHYINYKAFVNVVKYKLDHMRRKIETEERDNTSRASFVCTDCKKTYTDLEADQLCDLTTGEFRCTLCSALVEEDPSVLPATDSRLILAKFNEQIEPLYILLREVEDIILPSDLLEPELSEPSTNSVNNSANSATASVVIDSRDPWRSGPRRTDLDSMYIDPTMSVKVEGSTDAMDTDVKSEEITPKKEQPEWMTTSTIDFGYDDSHPPLNSSVDISLPSRRIKEEKNSDYATSSSGQGNGEESAISKEILELLMLYESESKSGSKDYFGSDNHILYQNGFHNQTNNHTTSKEWLDEDENIDCKCKVRVNGDFVPLSEIYEFHVKLMSDSEREEYIRIVSEIYSLLYD